jgi:trans-aconitate 2-methyltransferase
MPNNTHELSHAAMRMVAADGPWASRLLPVAKSIMVLGPLEEYYNLLAPLCSTIDIWQTVYVHPLDGPDGVVEWFEGSGLRPFLDLLDANERVEFLARYRGRLAQAYPRQPDGKVLLRYPRLFFALQK